MDLVALNKKFGFVVWPLYVLFMAWAWNAYTMESDADWKFALKYLCLPILFAWVYGFVRFKSLRSALVNDSAGQVVAGILLASFMTLCTSIALVRLVNAWGPFQGELRSGFVVTQVYGCHKGTCNVAIVNAGRAYVFEVGYSKSQQLIVGQPYPEPLRLGTLGLLYGP